MTNEQILELAEKHFSFIAEYTASGWIADTEDLLKFARVIYTEGFKVGYDEGWESSNVSTKMNTWSCDDD
jgi:hypothetical protein